MKKYILLVATSLLLVFALSAFAEERGTADEAKKMVKKAVDFYVKNGRVKALAEFNKTTGQFVYKDLYIWTENDGITTSHGKTPAVVGKNWLDMKDGSGKLFVREILKVAKEKGSGWVDYTWSDPITKKVAAKRAYIEKVPIPNDSTIVVCGFYIHGN
ncbi:MAG: cache domain-containing protein [Syntrophales bacterium]|nr:cache domain-containing protein [Syntrophales bacterium]